MKIFSPIQTKILSRVQKTDYLVGVDLLANLYKIPSIKEKNYSSFLILADRTVFNLFGEKIVSSLKRLKRPVVVSIVPFGEASKNLENIPNFITPFFQKGFNRKAVLVSLGGGVTTDIGGFLASILLRGIASIHIPTTLLGQVDAAIGGKSGVDFWLSEKTMYKNMIGIIKQPDLVISDTGALSSLPKKEVLNGLGEMVKYWIGWGRPNPEQLLMVKKAIKTPRGWPAYNPPAGGPEVEELVKTISFCQQIKIDIIQKDPFDTLGIREELNLGHTIGHAIEGVMKGKLSHGEAVSIGLVAAAKISVLKKFLKPEMCRLIVETITELGLPTTVSVSMFRNTRTNSRAKKNLLKIILSVIKFDKKGGNFVLVRDIGKIETGVFVEEKAIDGVLSEIIINH